MFKKSLWLLGIVLITGCTEVKIIEFDLNIILSQPVEGIKSNDPLPRYYAELCNYYQIEGIDTVFFPKVKFIREDLAENNQVDFAVELSGVNAFRKSMGMLPADIWMEEYDNNLYLQKTPAILYAEQS